VALASATPRRSIDAVEDALLFTRMADLGPIVNLPEALGCYRVHGSGVSAAQLSRQRMLLRWIEHNLRERRAGRPEIDEFAFEAREAAGPWFRRFRTRCGDLSAAYYRRAGARIADGAWTSGVPLLAAATVLNPAYSLGKLRRQVFARRKDGPA
jgi:hypothetical protein